MASSQAALVRYRKTFKSLPAKQVVEEIAKCKDLPTQGAVMLSGETREDNAFRKKLVDAGLIEVVLKLVNRCQNERFDDVLSETNGDVAFPSVWVNLLLNTVAHENLPRRQLQKVRKQIASSIGPLVKCMSNDKKREFFRENRAWHQTIAFFITLLQNLVLTPETVPILLEYKKLVSILVHSIFWKVYRPDMGRELESYGSFIMRDSLALAKSSAVQVLKEMCDIERDEMGQKRLETIAKTSIVASDYDDSVCDIVFADSLIGLLKGGVEGADHESTLYILQQFILGNIISQRTINGMIEYGAGHVRTYSDAEHTVGAMYNMLIPPCFAADGERKPDDNRFEIAIKSGLFEMCMGLLVKCGGMESGGNRMEELMGALFHGASAIALCRRTSKAITEHRTEIVKAIRSVKEDLQGTERYEELVSLVESIVRINEGGNETESGSAWCRLCLAALGKDEIKRCNGCKRAIYCSRHCQVEDWKHGGHKRDCKSMAMSELQVAQNGGSKRDIKKAQTHEENVSMAGNKVVFNNISSVIMQAIIQDYDLLDCLVMVDLYSAPPSIGVTLSSEFLANEMPADDENYDHSRRIIERNRGNGSLTVACISIGVWDKALNVSNAPRAILFKTIPGVAAPMGSWSAAQADAKQATGFSSKDMYPEEIEALLKDLKRATC